jgi:hypothetical protein
VINGEQLSEEYLKNRRVILPVAHLKKQLDRSRDFNILNLDCDKDTQQQTSPHRDRLIYDSIYGRYYNPEEEQHYWASKKEEGIRRAKLDFDVRLPPSYQTRERYIQDLSKPLPEPMKRRDQRQESSRRSHQAKYLFE